MRGDQAAEDMRDGGEFGKCRPAQQDRKRQCCHAIGADAAVAHDFELALWRAAAAKTIGGVAEPVLMQAEGDEHGGCERERCRRLRRKTKPCGNGKDNAADESYDHTDQRCRPKSRRQAAPGKIEMRQRQAGEEDKRKGKILGRLFQEPAAHRSAPRYGVEESAADMAAPPAGRTQRVALAVGEFSELFVRAV